MNDYVNLILFPLLVIVGWALGDRNFESGRRWCLGLGLFLLWHLLVLAVSGWWSHVDNMPWLHRWTAHSLVIFAWLATPFAIGVALGGQFRRRALAAVGKTLVVLGVLAVVLLNSFTGYIELTPEMDQATMNRFEVLHTLVLPGLSLLLLLLWCGLYAPPLKSAAVDAPTQRETPPT